MRRLRTAKCLGILGSLLLMLGPLAAFVAPVSAYAQADITCDDFVRQEAAQALLDADDAYAEALDPDGDGVACREEVEEDEGDEGDVAEDDGAADDEDAATDEDDEPASRNPLRGRFGGNRADFENAYGLPADDEERDYPVGVVYDVDGFRRVSVFFHRSYVAYITALPARDAPWTQSEAEEIVFAFLPADWEQSSPPIQTDDGDLLIPGHSPYMETRFSAATYARYDAQGEPGDAYFLLRLDTDAEVTGVEVGLGNNVQAPPDEEDEDDSAEGDENDEDEVAVEPEAAEYLADVRSQFDRLVASVDEFGRTITDPDFTTDQALFDRLIEILVLWSSATANARSLDPPADYDDLHQTFTEYAGLLSGASIDLTIGLSSGDQSSIESGGDQLQQAIALQPTIEAQLAEAGV